MESVQFRYNDNRKGYWTFGYNNKKFKTYYEAIIYTQKNILKEYKSLKKLIESK